jgi:thiamine-phosphate pyrophosphorylase
MTTPGTTSAAGLYGLTVIADDDPRWKHGPVEVARAACAGGAAVIQLRAKFSTDRVVLDWSHAIREVTRKHAVLFFVNDRFDLALAADADGVHLGQEDLPPACVPAEIRSRLLIGCSSHTLEQARAALCEPVDYVAFGPVFGTGSKQSRYSARGIPLLEAVVRATAPRPVIAIGGIDAGNARDVAAAGAAGAAVISAVAAADDAEDATRELAHALREATGR